MLHVGYKNELVHSMLLTTAKQSLSGVSMSAANALPTVLISNSYQSMRDEMESRVLTTLLADSNSKRIYCPDYIKADAIYEAAESKYIPPANAAYSNNSNNTFSIVSSQDCVAYFHHGYKFAFFNVATEVVSMMHARALKHYETYRDNALKTLEAFESEWCTYDDTVLYRSWLRNNLEFVNIYCNGMKEFDALSKETSHDKRVEFITCVAKLISAVEGESSYKRTGLVWITVQNGPVEMWYVGSMYALQNFGIRRGDTGNALHPNVYVFDYELYAPNFEHETVESYLVVGAVRSCNAVSRWGNKPEHVEPTAEHGLKVLGFDEVSKMVYEQCQKQIMERVPTEKFYMQSYIDNYTELYKACMEQEMYNVVSKLINSVVMLEQRVAGAGAVLSGGIQSW
jgi:hypothetical protein